MSDRVDQMLAALPRGHSLGDASWAPRHRLLLCLAAAHIPGLLIVAAVTGRPLPATLVELLPVGGGIVVGLVARSRVIRAAAVTLSLVFSTSVLVHLTGGLIEAHFHYFVVLGFVALYQDWRPYLVAVAYVIVGHGLVGILFPEAMYNHPTPAGRPWVWAAVHGGFVLAASAAHVIFWKQTERQQRAAEAYYGQLYDGERAVVAQLRQAQTLKDELIGVVGHEFRTPLTTIQGFARTLDARFDRMDHEAVQACTGAIEREAKRLTRLVANLLTASEEILVGEQDSTGVAGVASMVVKEVTETSPVASRQVRVHVPPDHAVGMSPQHLHQLLYNLLDNAVKFAAPNSDVRASSRLEGGAVVVEVANVGKPISSTDRQRIFDAFVQVDSSDTRRHGGIGLGLHIANKIVTAYGGRIDTFSDGPVVIFRTWLPGTAASGRPARAADGGNPSVYAAAPTETLLEA
jgi:signal transduction histidine kinase